MLLINSYLLTYILNSYPLLPNTTNSFLKLHGNTSLILREEVDDPSMDNSSRSILELALNHCEQLFHNYKELRYENYLLSLRALGIFTKIARK